MPPFPIQNDTNFHQIPPTGATVPSMYPSLLEITVYIRSFICLLLDCKSHESKDFAPFPCMHSA